MVTDAKGDGPSMGFTEAVCDVVDILCGRPVSGSNSPNNWERIVTAIAENDSLPDCEVKVIEKAIREPLLNEFHPGH